MPGTGLFTDDVGDLRDLPTHVVRDLETFLETYSKWEGNRIKLKGRCQAREAMKLVRYGVRAVEKAGIVTRGLAKLRMPQGLLVKPRSEVTG